MCGSLACVKLMPPLKRSEKLESSCLWASAETETASNVQSSKPNGFIRIKIEKTDRNGQPLTNIHVNNCLSRISDELPALFPFLSRHIEKDAVPVVNALDKV